MAYLPVSTHDGFSPLLAPEFVSRYGARSLFVRSTADLLTLRLARLLEAKGRRKADDEIARVVDDEVVDALAQVVKALGGDGIEALFQESMGTAPVGAFAAEVERRFGSGKFSEWLAAFEARDFRAASSLVGACHD